MIALPAQTQIWIAAGVIDLRRDFTGLSALVQTTLEQSPFSEHVSFNAIYPSPFRDKELEVAVKGECNRDFSPIDQQHMVSGLPTLTGFQATMLRLNSTGFPAYVHALTA